MRNDEFNLDSSANPHEELLDQAIASMCSDDGIATAAPKEIDCRILSRLDTLEASQPMPPSTWKTLIMKPAFRLSAAAVLVIAVAGVLWLSASGRVAFAETIAKVNAVHSVAFTNVITLKEPGGATRTTTMQITIAEPARMRQVLQPSGIVTVWNLDVGKSIALDFRTMTARIREFTGASKEAAESNVLEQFKNFDSNLFESIGDRTIDGRPAVGFRQKGTASPVPSQRTVWVDKETHLPLEIDAIIWEQGVPLPESSSMMKGFKWDVPVEDQMFSVAAPAGYQIQTLKADDSSTDLKRILDSLQTTTSPLVPVGARTLKDVLDALQTSAELNGGIFPDHFDPASRRAMTDKLRDALPPANTSEYRTAGEKLVAQIIVISRGMSVTIDPKQGNDWHYAGRNVAMGQPNTLILWYRPAGSETYRVIDAELNLRDVAATELPKIRSELLGAPITSPTTVPAAH